MSRATPKTQSLYITVELQKHTKNRKQIVCFTQIATYIFVGKLCREQIITLSVYAYK